MTGDEPTGVNTPSEVQRRTGAAFDRMVGNSVNTAIAAWLVATTGSPESAAAIGGLAGPLAEEVSFALRRVVNIQQAQADYVLNEAATTCEIPLDDLLEELVSDPQRIQLLLRSLEAAARSATEGKLGLIGHLLATGAFATDRAVVDEQALAIEAIGELETFHFRLLVILFDPSPVWWENATDRAAFRKAWPEDRILLRDSGLTNSLAALVAKLQSLGLARDVSRGSDLGPLWELTQFGRLCVEAVKERGEAAFLSTQGGREG